MTIPTIGFNVETVSHKEGGVTTDFTIWGESRAPVSCLPRGTQPSCCASTDARPLLPLVHGGHAVVSLLVRAAHRSARRRMAAYRTAPFR